MAETGNTAEIAALIERLTDAVMVNAKYHAEATVKPRLPQWATSLLVGLAIAFASLFVTGLVAWGQLQSRMAAVENTHPESLSSLATEVHVLNQNFAELQRRFNDLADSQSRARR